jgi:hypothetical protein
MPDSAFTRFEDPMLCRMKYSSWYAADHKECNELVPAHGNIKHAARCVDGKSRDCDRTHTFDKFVDGAQMPAHDDGDDPKLGTKWGLRLWGIVKGVFAPFVKKK